MNEARAQKGQEERQEEEEDEDEDEHVRALKHIRVYLLHTITNKY